MALSSPPSHPLQDKVFDFVVSKLDANVPSFDFQLTNNPEQEYGLATERISFMLQAVSV